jgi:8-oxo-dGTP diphosphatase
MVFDENPGIFHGYMPYENEKPIGWEFVRND